MKRAGNFRRVASATAIVRDGLKQRSEIEFAILKGKGYGSTFGARRARCSSHMAAWPSKVISRVKPSSAAAVSKRRPIDVVAKVLTSLRISSSALSVAFWKVKRSRFQIGQIGNLRKKACGGLHGMLRGGVAAGQSGGTQMRGASEAFAHAAGENFAAPDRSVIAIAGAVEADADHSFYPTPGVPRARRRCARGDAGSRSSSRR